VNRETERIDKRIGEKRKTRGNRKGESVLERTRLPPVREAIAPKLFEPHGTRDGNFQIAIDKIMSINAS
jgi:hypothetical protein